MCGIAGIYKPKGGILPDDVSAVQRMIHAQAHRGPDDEGLYHDDRVVLGHRRLSIIDLSAAGHQPMCNEDGSVWVTYNGEIYNYRELHAELKAAGHCFRSSSDTEILLHGYEQWGIEGLLTRLRGMFAFALYDTLRAICILARDRFGIKPLYYAQPAPAGRLVFASEVKAMVAARVISDERDREAIAGFLLFGSVPAPLTSVRGIRCLLPGQYLQTDSRGASLHTYWDFDSHPAGPSHADAALSTVLADSVARHLISDVSVGVFLSGGVDSAGLVALATRAQARLRTLTVVFDEQEFSEAASAREVAEHFGTDHCQVRVTCADFARELPAVLSAMDQPTHDGLNTYFVSQAARQAGLTVVLSGLGGDEIFWGYRYHRLLARHPKALWGFSKLPSAFRWPVAAGAVAFGKALGRENWMRLQSLSRPLRDPEIYLALRGFFAPAQVAKLMDMRQSEVQAIINSQFESVLPPCSQDGPSGDGINYIEIKRYLHDQLLRDADVFSMAHGIELRVPYLDHVVAESAKRLPGEIKAKRGSGNKSALVKAIDDPLLRELSKQPKHGFSFPLASWMGQQADDLAAMAEQADVFDRTTVSGLWQAFRRGRLHWSRAWALTVLGAPRRSSQPEVAHAVR